MLLPIVVVKQLGTVQKTFFSELVETEPGNRASEKSMHGDRLSGVRPIPFAEQTNQSGTEFAQWVVLGCGSSSGTPVLGCRCAVCCSKDPRNIRTRCSAYVRVGEYGFLIDTSPDLRYQALREQIDQVDAVLYTHPHADHLNGIDDLRAFCYQQQQRIPLYGNDFTLNNIRERFSYALFPPSGAWDKPSLSLTTVTGPFQHGRVRLVPIPLEHGHWPCTGWRIGSVAWLTDVSNIQETSLALLSGVRVLFLDCLRDTPYPSHLNVMQSLMWAKRIGAERTILIHMTHELDYQALSNRCPPGVEVAYDGLVVTA